MSEVYILILPGFGRATVRLSLEMLRINVDAVDGDSERHFTHPASGKKQARSNERGTIACDERGAGAADKGLNILPRAYDHVEMKATSFNLITFCGTCHLIKRCLRKINEST